MKRNLLKILTIATLGILTSGANALEMKTSPNAVLELFTSQGCSSCPPADVHLKAWGANPNNIAIAYHVDYWNYIGWKDVFSAPKYSKLQRSYAKSFGADRVYTPQLIVNGREDAVGSRKSDVENLVQQARLDVPVVLEVREDRLFIKVGDGSTREADATIWLVPFITAAETNITRGENRGHTYQYSYIARNRLPMGMWHGEADLKLELPLSQLLSDGADGLAILVQENHASGGPGPILGAAALQN